MSKKTNKEIIQEQLSEIDCTIGCYDAMIENLTKLQLSKIIDCAKDGCCDVLVNYKRKPYICEIFHVNKELDFKLTSKQEYIKQYGRDIYAERSGN